jgi:DNA-binding LytR/AlgR family response regulator
MSTGKINCIIVDDEPLAQELLEFYVQRVPFLNLVGKCNDAFTAMQLVQDQPVDLIFLDIEMPDLNGIEMLRTKRDLPRVIFTTAYPNYAVEGFTLNAIDYLLKPIPFERFVQAVNKAQEQIGAKRDPAPAAAIGTGAAGDPQFIFVKSDTQLLKVYLQDVLYIEGLGDYVKIHTKGKVIVTLQTLKNLAGKLPAERFIRVHRSFIVALDKIDSINGQTIFIGTHQVPIGNLYRDSFFEIVNQRNL